MMHDHLNLEALLLALREAGLPVGVTEVLRLQQVFDRQPDFAGGDHEYNRRRLKALLRAVLVKSQKDRAAFERVCDIWLKRAEQDLQAYLKPEPSALPDAKPAAVVTSPAVGRSRRGWLIAAVIVCLTVLVIGGYFFPWPTAPPPLPVVEAPPEQPLKSTQPIPRPDLRQKLFTTWMPTLAVTSPAAKWTGWPALGLGGLALLTAGALWFTLGRKRWLPEFKPEPTRPGPPRVFLQPPKLSGPQLLDARQQEALVWGIGRFIADEPSRHLDLPATVEATARRGGILTVQHQRASYQREVWLWLDETVEDSALLRLADEIEAILHAYGLVAERALFRGIPDRLVTPEGAVFAPHEIDERRDLALVAVLTDGRALARQYAVDDRRTRIDALLRGLSHWPQLAFVDFSADRNNLAWMLAKHDLERIAPAGLAAFLGGSTAIKPLQDWGHDDTAWAAVCALAPASVDEATALTLRRRLGLGVSPWALRDLRDEAAGPGGRLQWSPDRRVELLNWLRDAETHPAGGIAQDSLLDRALQFWEERYELEIERRLANDGVVSFKATPAHRQMVLEYNLILLWRRPEVAIPELYRLHQGSLQAVIERQLSRLAPLGGGGKGCIQLPWRWEQRSAVEQAMLQAMGFGGRMAVVRLRKPGRLWLGLGICLGLMLGECWTAWQSPTVLPGGPPVIVHGPEKPADAGDRTESAADRWRVSVHTRKTLESTETVPAAQVTVNWSRQERRCVETLEDGAELWRCGQVEAGPLAADIQRSLVVLVAKPGDAAIADLAIDLLTSGGADVVLIDPNWPRQRQALLGLHERLGDGQQLLVFTAGKPAQTAGLLLSGGASALLRAGNWSALTQALRFEGVRSVAKLPDVAVEGDKECLLRGIGGCQPMEETDQNGITFIRICPGEFMMGSPDSEKNRYDSEGPAHKVKVGEFSMGKYEVKVGQFKKFVESTGYRTEAEKGGGCYVWTGSTGKYDVSKNWRDPGVPQTDDHPVVCVSWNDANAYVEWLTKQTGQPYRLPTEAEWEYAARAGTQTRYSFGDDERQLGDYAWFSENSNDHAHPIGQKKPNPWGLYDMYGNAWEWVRDCYHNNYKGAPTDGSAWEADNCELRVLRGGSFDVGAWVLRSAVRGRGTPENRDGKGGFRCVRGSRRQP